MKKVLFSRASDHWSTPKFYLDLFSPTFDPCPLNADFDGLSIPWKGSILLNPPFSNQRSFVEKAIKEISNCDHIVLLLPARTDTKLFHELLYKKFDIDFIKGRLKFGGCKNSAPFPSMLVYLK